MQDFLRNLFILGILAALIFFLFPDMVRQILGIYGGLGLIPIILVLVIVAALPKQKRSRRR